MPTAREEIAVIGSGISGLAAAYLLSAKYDVTIIERFDALGMDASSISFAGSRIDVPLRLFDKQWYPNLTSLYNLVGVKYGDANAHFGLLLSGMKRSLFVTYNMIRLGHLSYLGNMGAIPAVRVSSMSVLITGLRDFIYFVLVAPLHMHTPKTEGVTLRAYLKAEKYSEVFVNHFLLPSLSAMFTCTYEALYNYPVDIVIDYFAGSAGQFAVAYKSRVTVGIDTVVNLLADPVKEVKVGCSVVDVLPLGDKKVQVKYCNQKTEEIFTKEFTQVVICTQANHVMKFLKTKNSELANALLAIPYEDGRVTVHTDESVMPTNKGDWATFNLVQSDTTNAVMCTVLCNSIGEQLRDSLTENVFQTWNPTVPIDSRKLAVDVMFGRPIMTLKSKKALETIQKFQGDFAPGADNIWFAGSYCLYTVPLLESGVLSSLRVAKALGVKIPWTERGTTMEAKSQIGAWHEFLFSIFVKAVLLLLCAFMLIKLIGIVS